MYCQSDSQKREQLSKLRHIKLETRTIKIRDFREKIYFGSIYKKTSDGKSRSSNQRIIFVSRKYLLWLCDGRYQGIFLMSTTIHDSSSRISSLALIKISGLETRSLSEHPSQEQEDAEDDPEDVWDVCEAPDADLDLTPWL